MNNIDLIEWRARVFGSGQADAAEALGLSLDVYNGYELGFVDTLEGRVGMAIPKILYLACLAVEAGLHNKPKDQPDDQSLVRSLSTRAVNCFMNEKIPITIEHISFMTDKQILGVQGMGRASLKEVRLAVLKAGAEKRSPPEAVGA